MSDSFAEATQQIYIAQKQMFSEYSSLVRLHTRL